MPAICTIIPVSPLVDVTPITGSPDERRNLVVLVRLENTRESLGLAQDHLGTLRLAMFYEAENNGLDGALDTVLMQASEHVRVAYAELERLEDDLKDRIRKQARAVRDVYDRAISGWSSAETVEETRGLLLVLREEHTAALDALVDGIAPGFIK